LSPSKERESILAGPIIRTLFRLGLPMMVAYGSQTLFNFVDRYFVARLGHVQVGALGMSFILIGVIFAFSVGIGMGTTSLISRSYGAAAYRDVKLAVMHACYLGTLLYLLLLMIGDNGVRWLFRLLGSSEDMLPYICEYTDVMLVGSVFIVGSLIGSGILRGIGDTVSIMKAMLIGNVLNVALDPLLIFGWGPFPALGIRGAALATIFARAIAFALMFYYITRHREALRPSRQHLSINFPIIKAVMNIGFPKTLGMLLINVSMGILFVLMKPYGDIYKSAHTIVFAYLQITFMFIIGLSGAALPMIGQNYGAGQHERMQRIFRLAAVIFSCFSCFMACLFILFRAPLIGLFSNSRQLNEIGSHILVVIALGSTVLGLRVLVVNTFGALGMGRNVLIVNFLQTIGGILPFALLFRWLIGVYGIWWGITVGNVLVTALSYVWLKGVIRRGVKKFVPVSQSPIAL